MGKLAPRVRLAEERDAAAIFELASAALADPWSEHSFEDALRRPGTRAWVVEPVPGEAPGLPAFLIASCVAGELTILMLAVDPGRRRRGIGREVLRCALRDAWGRDLDRVHLEVRETNRAAQALYHEMGFVVVGVRPRYYRGGEDALLMSLDLAIDVVPNVGVDLEKAR